VYGYTYGYTYGCALRRLQSLPSLAREGAVSPRRRQPTRTPRSVAGAGDCFEHELLGVEPSLHDLLWEVWVASPVRAHRLVDEYRRLVSAPEELAGWLQRAALRERPSRKHQ